MTLNYVGERAFNERNHRLAEFSYKENEEERFMRIASALEEYGYKIDTGVEGWAAIEVDDMTEFEEIKKDFQYLRRTIK